MTEVSVHVEFPWPEGNQAGSQIRLELDGGSQVTVTLPARPDSGVVQTRVSVPKALAAPPSPPPRKKPQRDPNMPRKPPSAFFLYCNDKRNELKQQQPDLKTGPQIQTALGMAWRAPRMLSTRGSVHETQ